MLSPPLVAAERRVLAVLSIDFVSRHYDALTAQQMRYVGEFERSAADRRFARVRTRGQDDKERVKTVGRISASIALLVFVGCSSSDTPERAAAPTADSTSTSARAPTLEPPSTAGMSAEQWQRHLTLVLNEAGVRKVVSPEHQFRSARVTGVWRSEHAVVAASYDDLAHGGRGDQLRTVIVAGLETTLFDAPQLPDYLRFPCRDKYMELSVVQGPRLTVKSQMSLPLTEQLAETVIGQQSCPQKQG